MSEYDLIPKHIDPAGLTEKQITYWRRRAATHGLPKVDEVALEACRAARTALQANLDALYIPEIRPVPVWHEFGGRALSEAEHLALVAEAADLREWLVRWYGLVPGDLLCHRERQDSGHANPAGTLAGCDNGGGYLHTRALGRNHLNHHLIFLLYHGRLPAPGLMIDHIDGDRQNNKIENLREVSRQGNGLNASFNDKTLPHGLRRVTRNYGRNHYIKAETQVPSTRKARAKSIRIKPWPKNPDGSPALGEDGLPLRNPDEIAAIETLAPLWRSWREELYGVPAT